MREYESNHLLAVGGSWSELKCLLAANDDLIGKIEPPLSATSKRKAAERYPSCGRWAKINKTCWHCLPCEIEYPAAALQVRMPYHMQ